MPPRPITRLRKLCLAFPEAHEVEAWGEPIFRVRNKIFAMYASANTHHGAGRPAVWLKSLPEHQAQILRADPNCFFKPPYVGVSGWIGIWLDGVIDWEDLHEFVEEAYRLIAPKRVVAAWDAARATKGNV
jgi:hypothetical protein